MHLKVVLQTNLSVSMRSTITQMEPELLQGGKNKAEIPEIHLDRSLQIQVIDNIIVCS